MSGSFVTPAFRDRIRELATPVATALGRLGLTPNALTVIGFLGTCVAAYAAAMQAWLLAGLLVLAFGTFDLLDGALARAQGKATRLGAFLDSVFDRAGEAVVYVGIVIGLVDAGWAGPPLWAAGALAASQLVPYARAKAEAIGVAPGNGIANVGLAPREVRLVILTIGLVGAGLLGTAGISALPIGIVALEAALGLITILSAITVLQRIVHVRQQLGNEQ